MPEIISIGCKKRGRGFFVGCIVLVLAGTAGSRPALAQDSGGAPLHTRVEVHDLTDAQVNAFRAGVTVMMNRAADDPTSWIYQANIHGAPADSSICPKTPGAAQPGWSTCQHGSFFFLAWHRMYLYYFERILRAAVREGTGNPNTDFSLPYWEYSDPSYHALPQAFRVPANATNSLYVAARAPACNNGDFSCIPDASAVTALHLTPFCSCAPGTTCTGCATVDDSNEAFGGQHATAPLHSGSGDGALELQPHNAVHNYIGGDLGWMSYPDCAARDPIFWVHHASIDRLWQVWLNQGGGRTNPLGAPIWGQETFIFFDENKHQVTLTACQILNMATQLDYQYADVPVNNVTLCGDSLQTTMAASAASASPKTPTLLAATSSSPRILGQDPLSLQLPLPATAAGRVDELTAAGAATAGRLRLLVEGVTLLHPGGVFNVFVDLPAGQPATVDSPYYVGNIALFGGNHDGHASAPITRSFDITDKLRELRQKGLLSASPGASGALSLTFLRGNPQTEVPVARRPVAFLTFTRVSIVER